MRPRTGGRLENIKDGTAENGGRLENIEDVLGHLQNVLDDIQANQDADEPNSDQGQHNGAASARGSMSDKLWLKERITGWKNPNLGAFWILCGEKPKGCALSRVQLQGVFQNTALVSSAVVEEVNALAGHDVTAFMPRGAEPGTAGTTDIEKQFATLARVLLLGIGRDITSVGGKARVEKLRTAFQDGVDMVTSHGEANHQAIQMPVHKVRIALFINKDPEDWWTAVHDAALSAKSNWHEPNCQERWFPPGQRLAPILTLVGWSTSTFTSSVGPPGGGCLFERKRDLCKYRHDSADESRGQKESGGGASGVAHKKPKAGVRTVPSASSSGDGDGGGKGGSSAISSKGDDE